VVSRVSERESERVVSERESERESNRARDSEERRERGILYRFVSKYEVSRYHISLANTEDDLVTRSDATATSD
jgi:hypothetical protein